MSTAGAVEIDIREKRFERVVLRDFRLSLAEHEFVALQGPSGCGKTTLLNLVAGLDTDFDGTIDFATPPCIGYVFQEPRLLPWRSVFENLTLVQPDHALVESLLHEVGLWESRDVHPQRLSLGMARRVALARAFAVRPTLLLMDEPFVSLDAETAERLRELLLRVLREHPAAVLFVTHDGDEARRLAGRVVTL